MPTYSIETFVRIPRHLFIYRFQIALPRCCLCPFAPFTLIPTVTVNLFRYLYVQKILATSGISKPLLTAQTAQHQPWMERRCSGSGSKANAGFILSLTYSFFSSDFELVVCSATNKKVWSLSGLRKLRVPFFSVQDLWPQPIVKKNLRITSCASSIGLM